MKYRLVLVEDEPAAAENIYDIIRLYCPKFELAATAENGREGLELARRCRPDLLLTDIKMPVMDGIELIKRLHEEMPDIKTIILSGYQDFEYARAALQNGAADYLLKPISPSTLQATLSRVIPMIENDRAQKRLNFIQELLSEGKVSPGDTDVFFPAPGYVAGLCRKNGLPGRFSGIRRVFPPASSSTGDTIDFYGRDDMECIHIQPGNSALDAGSWDRISWLNQDIPGYRTIVFESRPFPIRELPHRIEELYSTLTRSLVIGKSRIIASGEETVPPGAVLDSGFETSLVYYYKDNRSDKIKELLHEQLELRKKTDAPQLRVEEWVHSFLEQVHLLHNEGNTTATPEGSPGPYGSGNGLPEDKIEFLISDAFYYATGYADLEENLLYILEKLLPGRELNIGKIDTPEFFGLIEEYTRNKLAEPLSLQQACVHFGISQTYMSRLFRKYTGLSFTNYLTRSRIEKAKQYLSGGGTLIKDAAALTGFNDQFYFSKVFKSLTGLSPSEFISGMNETAGATPYR